MNGATEQEPETPVLPISEAIEAILRLFGEVGGVQAIRAHRIARAAFAAQDERTRRFFTETGEYPDSFRAECIRLRPAWEQAERQADWRNYIPEPLRREWLNLPPDARAALYGIAAQRAFNEIAPPLTEEELRDAHCDWQNRPPESGPVSA